ncbi:4Fe-4S dicluster domain-containing protein [Dermatophilus congolensis]|uniref:4Fe-4S dicluster domain-containing protein n=1 Tax=Dermatophilus congolensis TaxID=1863 RepID=UPI001AAED718|nr:4Fe-4S dicluster domain-containing protein [Dermatophilus congolensis]MBO3143639.1 4Fe-4S dicluster domain-containing protein [Dermatophilus congolensis]MBO3152631.1 4Fe-4S dicluster domain-containing protein [Dermatophilus congolensis]MBO3160357.1 4Fe-4S dicluster domain-containing protein [Dermatophilus congolensis]MBO3163916.1 4Fe-4S dicluster domain-containing protein [Dermatophilus congolensis]MBO3177462.1 4Fe-4S dicluster domain-containing protein [Dermatophilus congolensis]
MGFWRNQLYGPTNPITDSGWKPENTRKGFFTDTSICIGCKACEVACKEWNRVPARGEKEHGNQLLGSSYDNSGHLGANTWRHVAFIEQGPEQLAKAKASGAVALGMPSIGAPPAATSSCGSNTTADTSQSTPQGLPAVRWLMSSDVCKHCTHAGCLDVCPTGALFRSEFGTVVVQADVCNGCGMCVAACPFGVIGRRENGTVTVPTSDGNTIQEKIHNGGVAQKCTLCYDRIKDGQKPACAQTCPTTSIKFGDHADMVKAARKRLADLHAQGRTEARLYGANPHDGVGGTGSVFLLMDEPEAYGLPPDPVVPTRHLSQMFTKAGIAGTAMIGIALAVFAGNGSLNKGA